MQQPRLGLAQPTHTCGETHVVSIRRGVGVWKGRGNRGMGGRAAPPPPHWVGHPLTCTGTPGSACSRAALSQWSAATQLYANTAAGDVPPMGAATPAAANGDGCAPWACAAKPSPCNGARASPPPAAAAVPVPAAGSSCSLDEASAAQLSTARRP